MKSVSIKPMPNGKRRVTVELDEGEQIIPVREDAHYRLGDPVSDVIGGHILTAATRVSWCSAAQEWVE